MKKSNYNQKKYILLQGGIGNQIFQYIFGQYMKLNYGYDICYNFIDTSSKKADSRQFELNKIFEDIVIKKNIYLSIIQKFKILKLFLIKFIPLRRLFYTVIDDEINTLDSNSIINNKYFIGYWINLFYYDNINLKNHLNFKRDIISSDYGKTILKKIKKEKSSVSIHLRRGDYLNLSNLYYNLEKSYYLKSIGLINNELNIESTFFVFSDDIEFAKKMFKDLDVFFVENFSNAVEELFLMSKCNHNIIANSTFSLCAALFNQNQDKICVSPDKWLKNNDFKTPKNSYFHYVNI